MAFIVCREPAARDELQEYCGQRLAKYKVPAEFRLVAVLPRTAVGKIDKVELARQARSRADIAN